MNKLLLVIVIIGLACSPVFLHAQHLFSVEYNELSKENVNQLKTQIGNSEISTLSLTKNNENKDVFPVAFSSVDESKLVIFNEQTGNHVVVTPVEESLTEFQLSPFFLEELRQSVLGDAAHYLVMETTSDFSLKKVSSVSASNGEVYVPSYFYGTKENVQKALPQDRQIIYVFKQKPQFISAFPDDPEQQSYIAQLEEELSYYIYMFKLPDGTLCTYDEHFNPDNSEVGKVGATGSRSGNLEFNLSGQLTTQQQTTTQYALDLWSQQLAGTVPIDIKVSIINLGGGGVLGQSYRMQNFLNTSTNTWYPSTLWNQLVGYDATSMNDIKIEMNSNFTFYWGLDGNTTGYDYVTIMLHEVCHGLGFFPLCSSNGSYYYTNASGYSVSTNYPGIFDRQLFQGTSGSCLTDLTQSQRATLLVSNNLYAGAPGSHLVQAHGSRVKIYAPTTYSPGSSNSHWNDSPGFGNFMQYAYQYPLHTFNTRKIGILLDLGWTLPSSNSCNPPTNLTVNYTSGCDAQLNWQAPTKGRGTILWDNTNINYDNSGIMSTYWGNADTWTWCADDFDATGAWTIEKIYSAGFSETLSNPNGILPTKMAVVIYQNSGNQPGTEIYRNTNIPITDGSEPVITLPTPFTLPGAGKYWIAIAGAYNTHTANDEWYIYFGITPIGLNAHLTDPAGTFGISGWYDLAQIDFYSMYFKIEGTAGGTPSNLYNIYRDGVKIISNHPTTSYTDTGFNTSVEHTWSVKHVCTDGESDPASVTKTACAQTYTLTPSAGSNGTINPNTPVTVNQGGSQTFTFSPATNYEIDVVKVDGSNVSISNNQYTFNNVTANHTINVTFKLKTYTITASSGSNGSISPSGNVTVNHGASRTFTFSPTAGYEVDVVKVDGTNVNFSNNQYTFNNVTANHTINVTFKPTSVEQHTITATAGSNGAISPSGAVIVNHGANQTFFFQPDSGNQVDEVKVDGATVNVTNNQYAFTNVTANHTIHVTFKTLPPGQYMITVIPNDLAWGSVQGGGVYPAGASVDVLATPAANCSFVRWMENGVTVSDNPLYTFVVEGDRYLIAWFEHSNSIGELDAHAPQLYYFDDAIYFKNVPQGTTVQIFDVCGKLVHQTVATGERIPFLQKGFYVVRLIDLDKTAVTKKIVAY